MSDNESETTRINPETKPAKKPGLFQKGGPGGPGRPKGVPDKLNVRAQIKRTAKETGRTLDEVASDILNALIEKAKGGDVAAAKVLVDHIFQNEDKAPAVAVQVNNQLAAQMTGPPEPTTEELAAYFGDLARLSGELTDAVAASKAPDMNGSCETPLEDSGSPDANDLLE